MHIDMEATQATSRGDMDSQDVVARDFMRQRGYYKKPKLIERVEGDFCWYYYYDLPEGELELEVSWEEKDGWQATVTDFVLSRTNDDDDR